MPWLTLVWNFIKAHWQPIALVVAVAVGYGWYRHHIAADAAALAQVNAANQVEIDAINKARSDEQAQHQQELQQLQTTLQQIQQQYTDAQAQLASQQQQEQQQIVTKYGSDATGLAQLLAGKMGFTVQTAPTP